MYDFIEGILIRSEPLSAVVDCHGIGFSLHVPLTSTTQLPPPGEKVRLYTRLVVREDAHDLYGFHRREERDFFTLITQSVSGVGPRLALNLLSRISMELMRDAIARSDVAILSKCPGIGRKTAEKIVIEMRDRLGIPASATEPMGSGGTPTAESPYADAVRALVSLGFKPADADKAIRTARQKLGEGSTTEDLVKLALR